MIRLEYERKYAPGEIVRISGGPFSEHQALFEADNDARRVFVLLIFSGGEREYELPART